MRRTDRTKPTLIALLIASLAATAGLGLVNADQADAPRLAPVRNASVPTTADLLTRLRAQGVARPLSLGAREGIVTVQSDEDDPRLSAAMLITPATKRAIDAGVAFIASTQDAETGALGTRSQYAITETALGGLALLAAGHQPGRGRYGAVVVEAARYLINTQSDTGYIANESDSSRIHGHGFATLFLAQVFGTIQDQDMHEELERAINNAVRVIEAGQTNWGGWGYEPGDRTFDEASTTICQVQALRAARDAGIRVRSATIRRSIQYVRDSAVRIDWVDIDGNSHVGYNFKYSLRMNSYRPSIALTSAAISVLHATGRYEGEIVRGGLSWVDAFFNGRTAVGERNVQIWSWYTHFYAAQALYHADKPRYFLDYYRRQRDAFVSSQNSTRRGGQSLGYWSAGYGDVYATGIATMILAIPYGFLPLFQR